MSSADKTITKGKLVIDVKYWIFSVYSETDDICTKTACPATAEFELSHSQTLPSITPPVRFCTFYVRLRFWSMMCIFSHCWASCIPWEMTIVHIHCLRSVLTHGRFVLLQGSYTIQMKMLGENDEELSCISFGFSIGFLAPVALSSSTWAEHQLHAEIDTCGCNLRYLFYYPKYMFSVYAAPLCVRLRRFYQELSITISWKSGLMKIWYAKLCLALTIAVSLSHGSGLGPIVAVEKILS